MLTLFLRPQPQKPPQVHKHQQGKFLGNGASRISSFPHGQASTLPLSLTDPTLLSSCSSALLNKALLWMAAMASGCSCLMAWQASLRSAGVRKRAG